MKQTKHKTEWDLSLLYKSTEDPRINQEMRRIENLHLKFEEKYKNKSSYLRKESVLFTALVDYEKLWNEVGDAKPLTYLNFIMGVDSSDKKAEALFTKLSDQLTKIANRILFFQLSLGDIPSVQQKKFLASKKLAHFNHFLTRIFIGAEHKLSESEEKILNLKVLPSYELWVNGVQKALSKKTIFFKNKQMPIPEANNKIPTLPTKERRAIYKLVLNKLKETSEFSESELNAIYINKKISDELRHFKKPYGSTLLSHQMSEKTLLNVLKSVKKYVHVSHDFYKLKSKLLRLDHLEYADRSALVGKQHKKMSFKDAFSILYQAFDKINPKYSEILSSYLVNGQVDVFPKKGKQGGAYCSGGLNRPTFVLLNYAYNFDSIMTFGHEMGHAFHTELSKSQTPLYQGYSTAVAEVASTLFEQIVFDEVFKTLNEKEKIVALHDKIQDDVQTIFRQIACFNFELSLHEAIRTKGFVTKEEIAKLMNQSMKEYLGPAFRLSEDDGYFFIQWPHIRIFFYVYSYAFGQIVSKSLFLKYKKDEKFWEKIEHFLSTGGSKTPEEIFKDMGINVTRTNFFEIGLASIERDVKQLEILAKRAKLI